MDWMDLDSLSMRNLALSPISVKALYISSVAAVNIRELWHAEGVIRRREALDETGAGVNSRFGMALVHERRSAFQKAAKL